MDKEETAELDSLLRTLIRHYGVRRDDHKINRKQIKRILGRVREEERKEILRKRIHMSKKTKATT